MTAMTPELFRKLRSDTKPFTLRMVGGQEHHVPDPCFAALGRDKVTMIVPRDDGWFSVLRLTQIESITTVDEPAA